MRSGFLVIEPNGLGRVTKHKVFLPSENLLRILSNCPTIMSVRNAIIS